MALFTSLPLLFLSCLPLAAQAITIYDLQGVLYPGSATTTSDTAAGTAVYDPANYSGYAAFNPVILAPPAVPSPAIATQFDLPLAQSAAEVSGLSIPVSGDFLGFSIEMSVVTQVIGINASYIQVPFLNLMALVTERSGRVNIRVGGNTQDYAVQVASLPDNKGRCVEKETDDTYNPTETPTLLFTPELMYLMSNVSSLVNIYWYLGIPFNDTTNWRLEIAETGEAILGDTIIGFQVGNEPDLYADHGHRPENYSASEYFIEFGEIIDAIDADSKITTRGNLIAPSVSGTWTPEDVWNTGFITAYSDSLGALAVEHYPADNCAALYPDDGFGDPVDPQDIFSEYLTHASGQDIVAAYLNSTAIAQTAGKPFLMFETNTASCGGFPGVSDSFGAALWAADYGLQMAYSNFTGANLHVGGLDDTYNPFIPPPTNMSDFEKWTIGPIFYSVLVVAEALGKTNTSRVVDLFANSASDYTPAYAIYENDTLARAVLFNYITDSTGASTYTASISVEDGTTPSSVRVKYLLAESVSVKENMTWAGQTLGDRFEVDGRFSGTETIETVQCDGYCNITVPAPGIALVFLTEDAFEESSPTTTLTFPTTAVTNTITVTVNPSILSTSNGNDSGGPLGSTDSETTSAAVASARMAAMSAVVTAAFVACLSMVWVALR